MEWYLGAFKKYATFGGRARRKEYWMFFLFNVIFSFIAGFADGLLHLNTTNSSGATVGLLGGLYSLAVLLPSLAVAVRRLHDTGRSGWWMLISLIPIIGGIWLLIYLVQEGNTGANQYGSDPKATDGDGVVATGAAWFPDATGRHEMRYWDGTTWTEHVSDAGVASIDPV